MTDGTHETLRPLPQFRSHVTLVPFSGIQFLDFGFELDTLGLRPWKFVEQLVRAADGDRRTLIPQFAGTEASEPVDAGPDDVEYSVQPTAALAPFLSHWVPVPILRRKAARASDGNFLHDPGPTTWARLRIVALPVPDPQTGHTHRMQLALDTALVPANPDASAYLTPLRSDAERATEFDLVTDPQKMGWFLRDIAVDPDGTPYDLQQWVSDWLEELYLAHKRAERPGRPPNLRGQFEHWSHYLALLQLVARATPVPTIRLVNTLPGTRDTVTPIDVDLVLDIGNSRTCGVLIERFPDETRTDLAKTSRLEIRNLSAPEFSHAGLLSSRVEFAEARFGNEQIAGRSGRQMAFLWPGVVRVGTEAMHLVGREQGTETQAGVASPKRYLWDVEPRSQDWRVHNHHNPHGLPRSLRTAMLFVNEAGDVLDQVRHEEASRLRPRGKTPMWPALRPRFARSALFGFMLTEIIAHALLQMNDPGWRSERRQSDAPRRLRRIILTLPTATPMQEQAIMRSRAEGALRLLWSIMDLDAAKTSTTHRPDMILDWDEASCTQMVYLYSELTQKFAGNIDAFLELLGNPRQMEPGAAARPSLRVACIDIGGGTTDLMISTFWCEGGKMLLPRQDFREGFRIAGDDLVQRIVSVILLPRIQRSIEAAGGQFVGERLRELFAGGTGGQKEQLVHIRRQFGLQVLVPLAVAVLSASETGKEVARLRVAAAEVIAPDGEAAVQKKITDYLETAAHSLGASGWKLAELVIEADTVEFDAIVRDVFQLILSNMGEVIGHLGADVVLLTGRPSRLAAVRNLFEAMLVVPPHRLIQLHSYRSGPWYPFRDPITQRIADPKSTVVVGAMLMALSAGNIPSFKIDTSIFRMRSTARFVGEMSVNGQIPDDRVLFANLDLDADRSHQDQTATLKMFAPVHLGSRQLPLARWTTTPLMRLDFATAAALRRPVPLSVSLSRAGHDDSDATTAADILRREALREFVEIIDVEDAAGDAMKASELRLRLHTLGFDDDHWLETGLFKF